VELDDAERNLRGLVQFVAVTEFHQSGNAIGHVDGMVEQMALPPRQNPLANS
jgi:hypothetical protein